MAGTSFTATGYSRAAAAAKARNMLAEGYKTGFIAAEVGLPKRSVEKLRKRETVRSALESRDAVHTARAT